MFNSEEYKNLSKKYGSYASWAIWNYKNACDTAIIDQNFNQLHSRYVLLGLNISRPLTNTWSNFHDNSHARKIKYACNDTELRGSYLTDIFKGIVAPRATGIEEILTDEMISENVQFFNQEMRDVRIGEDTKFVIFGTRDSFLANCFNEYFKQNYKNQIIYYYHYAYFTFTDKEWVDGIWNKLDISHNFDSIIKKYEK